AGGLAVSPDAVDVALEQATDLFQIGLQRRGVGVAEVTRQNQAIKALVGRTLGDVVETEFVGDGGLAKSLGEVGRNAARGPAKLRGEGEQFVLGEALGEAVNGQSIRVGFLPDEHVTEGL